jgi:hypothetical protein
MKTGLEEMIPTQKTTEPRVREIDTARSRSERCKFCKSLEHLEEECEEADRYILAGKCKRDVFGRLTLPSGAQVPHRIKGKNLRERFEEYYRQYPGQEAAPAYLESLASARRLTQQGMNDAMSLATRTTPVVASARKSSEVRTAAKSLTLPEEKAIMYLAYSTSLRLARDPKRAKAKVSKRS